MNAPPRPSPPALVTAANATPLSQHVSQLFLAAGIKPSPYSTVLAQLLLWALAHPPAEALWREVVERALAVAEAEGMQVPAETLGEIFGLEQATTLQEAGQLMRQAVADLIPPGSEPT
jgi:ketopantoate reductase